MIMTNEQIKHALDNLFEGAFLVYYYKGEIKIREGNIKVNRIFEPYDNPNRYHTKLDDFPMRLRYGKVWCRKAEEVPKAVEMVKQARQNYLSEVNRRYEMLKGEINGREKL